MTEGPPKTTSLLNISGRTPPLQPEVIEIDPARNGLDCLVTAAFLRALKLKWEQLYYHSMQVGLIAEQIGIAIGLNKDRIRLLKTAGYLHDIGKLALRNDILNKPSSPDSNEWEQIRLHPELGATALHDFNGFDAVSKIILHHHEDDNGSGYPFGLRGDAIPYEAKIIRICDVYSAMTNERPYKPSFPKREAIAISMRSVSVDGEHSIAIERVLAQISLRKD
jgi:putative nucleotidyltransferase with HDIG domain